MASVGEIWSDANYYPNPIDGRPERKHFAILGNSNGDFTVRLLTSQHHGRPTTHVCYEDDTYPAFYLGVIDPSSPHLSKQSWLDLRYAPDIDDRVFARLVRSGDLTLIGAVPAHLLCGALFCAATAIDTRPWQQKRIYASRLALGCP